MWELDYKESWVSKNWCFWTVVLEKTLENTLDCKEIQLVHPKGDQSWIFIGRTDAEAETPILWPPDAKSWFMRKDLDAWRDWRQEEKGMTEDKMVDGLTGLMDVSLSKLWEMVKVTEIRCAAVCGVAKSSPQLSDWTPPPIQKSPPKPHSWLPLVFREKHSSSKCIDDNTREPATREWNKKDYG